MKIEIKYQHSDDDKEYVKVFESEKPKEEHMVIARAVFNIAPREEDLNYNTWNEAKEWLENIYTHHKLEKKLEADLSEK